MQKFIVLGHGYSEIFELKALLEYNHTRVDKAIFFHHEDAPSTFSLVMKPVEKDFQALYTILRGLRNGPDGKMYEMIHNLCKEYGVEVVDKAPHFQALLMSLAHILCTGQRRNISLSAGHRKPGGRNHIYSCHVLYILRKRLICSF